jgi:hypothetical protein
MKRLVVIFFALTIAMGACIRNQDPETALSQLNDELKANCENYTQEDWENAAERYSAIEEEVDGYGYTKEELVEIGRLEGRINAYFVKYAIDQGKNQMYRGAGMIKGMMEVSEEELGSSGLDSEMIDTSLLNDDDLL